MYLHTRDFCGHYLTWGNVTIAHDMSHDASDPPTVGRLQWVTFRDHQRVSSDIDASLFCIYTHLVK